MSAGLSEATGRSAGTGMPTVVAKPSNACVSCAPPFQASSCGSLKPAGGVIAATGVGSIEGTDAAGIDGGTIACDGATRAVLTDAGGTVSAVSVLDEVQLDKPIQVAMMAEVAAEKRMMTRTQNTDPALTACFQAQHGI